MNNMQVLNNTEVNTNKLEVLKPVENITAIKLAFVEIEQIKKTLLDSNDIVRIKWKNYINKRGYRKLAIAFSISTEIIKETRIERDNIVIYDFSVRATSPMWRYMEASASCASNERDFNNLENDVRATGQTRATNRAISDLIWLWEVSFEEVNTSNTYNTKTDITVISSKQRNLLIKLVESKYQDEHIRNWLYKKINTLSKQQARNTIKQLIEEWVEI